MGLLKSIGRAVEVAGAATLDVASGGVAALTDDGLLTSRVQRRHKQEDALETMQAVADLIKTLRR